MTTSQWQEIGNAARRKIMVDPRGHIHWPSSQEARDEHLRFCRDWPSVAKAMGISPPEGGGKRHFDAGEVLVAKRDPTGACIDVFIAFFCRHMIGDYGEYGRNPKIVSDNLLAITSRQGVIRSKFGNIHAFTVFTPGGPQSWVELRSDAGETWGPQALPKKGTYRFNGC
jgi:hypothetical protein